MSEVLLIFDFEKIDKELKRVWRGVT